MHSFDAKCQNLRPILAVARKNIFGKSDHPGKSRCFKVKEIPNIVPVHQDLEHWEYFKTVDKLGYGRVS